MEIRVSDTFGDTIVVIPARARVYVESDGYSDDWEFSLDQAEQLIDALKQAVEASKAMQAKPKEE